jgi:(E)-4-hydroxy-3-methylbut-2-enyl-diphosphate synthase
MTRRQTRKIKVGGLYIGGDAPIAVQTMTNTDTHDKIATLSQVRAMEAAGADVVRLAVPDEAAAATFAYLKEEGVRVPLVADIHFDYRIALASVAAGADKIRINPGNIGSREKVGRVVEACRAAGVPIRIGVNSGSLEKEILQRHGAPTAAALAESALYHAALLEEFDFYDTVLSVKASTVPEMIAANRILAEKTSYPLHLGVTEAGGAHMGVVKSAVGIGACLADGIGDTIRVSLTADPLLEIREARAILSALGLNPVREMDIISCPTCGRTKIDLIPLLARFEEELDKTGLRRLPLRVAFMGCVVNGPGEAREADIGIAGGIGEGILFKKGEIVRRVPEDSIVPELIAEIRRMTNAE